MRWSRRSSAARRPPLRARAPRAPAPRASSGAPCGATAGPPSAACSGTPPPDAAASHGATGCCRHCTTPPSPSDTGTILGVKSHEPPRSASGRSGTRPVPLSWACGLLLPTASSTTAATPARRKRRSAIWQSGWFVRCRNVLLHQQPETIEPRPLAAQRETHTRTPGTRTCKGGLVRSRRSGLGAGAAHGARAASAPRAHAGVCHAGVGGRVQRVASARSPTWSSAPPP